MSTFLDQAASLEGGLADHDFPEFDPERHLIFNKHPDFLTMEDIGFAENIGVSPVAVTQPFQLFSPEAIQAMRSEILKAEVTKNHTFSSNIAAAQLRGYARDHAPFTYAAWNHPETIAIISQLAGVDLIPWSDYEIAHINLSVKSEEQAKAELDVIQQRKRVHIDEGIDMASSENDKPIVGWHTDSYPFVCVLMMSNCTDMVGGETALRTANGEVIRVRGPTEGCAVILQGRYITHQALRALGARERITAVTSWRPRSPFVKDDTELRTVRPVSDLNELYYDFAEYRLEIMEQRCRRAREEMRVRRQDGRTFDTTGHKSFLAEESAFMQRTSQELVEEEKVRKGSIETVNIPDVVVAHDQVTSTAKRIRLE
ncbi:Nn.00g099970.m01.CDS01 [Neocucurbitaria sp. VM-36]